MFLSPRRSSPPARIAREIAFSGALVLSFVGLLGVVAEWAPTSLDQAILVRVQSILWGDFEFIPRLGSDLGGGTYGFFVLPAIVSSVFAWKRHWHLFALIVGLFLLHFVLISPKIFLEAYRPSPAFGVEGAGGLGSFPSGHVQWAVSFYGFIAYLIWNRSRRHLSRAAAIAAWAGIVLLTMMGRIELGRHWPIDTVGGVLAGLVALHLLIALHRWLTTQIRPHDRLMSEEVIEREPLR
jgi:undecaprenyl-diphosphatase